MATKKITTKKNATTSRTTKAKATVRNAKNARKAEATRPSKKNAIVNSRDVKGSKPEPKKLSQIEAAIIVLGKSREAMNCKEMVEAMQVAGLWSSPNGATPEATLYAAILREINTKGKDARFKKTDRGHFALASRK